jgi:hypothetical protein
MFSLIRKEVREMAENKEPAKRDNQGRFVKGQSGNPKGRPTLPKELIEYAKEAPERLREIADATESLKLKADIEKWFAEMYYGKASQRVDVEGKMDTIGSTVVKFEGELDEWSK